ncbi:MAG: protein kinase domain-containing protein, partial [Dermatophilaceae bacterium]
MSQPPERGDVTQGRPLGSRYRLGHRLGRGAMGEVYRATGPRGESLAVKVLYPDLARDPAIVSRFVQERTILTRLSHPNIVSVRDLVVEGDVLAIVMDFVDGNDLRRELTDRGTFAPAEAARITADVLRGLAAVHAADIIHRDLKPENVLLQPAGDGGWLPKLTDFGISKINAGSTSSRRTSVIGTPEYMAPELIQGQDPTPASDLYAAGIMLYELICGITPFHAPNAMAILNHHSSSLQARPQGVPDPLWAIIDQLLQKDPAARPASAALVAAALDATVPALLHAPPLAPLTHPPANPDDKPTQLRLTPPGPPANTAPPPRRRITPAVIALSITALLALTGSAAFVLTHTATTNPTPAAASPPTPTTPPPTPTITQTV